jgi:hypothetical protein
MMNCRILLTGLVAALASCNGNDPVAPQANNIDAATNVAVIPPDETAATGIPDGGERAISLIPAALHGRWALSPNDCTSTKGDAKGLMVVSADRLRFYESVARPSPGVQTSDNMVSGNFAFTGEGTSWSRYQTLELRVDKLVRTVNDPTQTFTYVRCE